MRSQSTKPVGTGLTLVAELRKSAGFTSASIEILNLGAVALNACETRLLSEGMSTGYTLAGTLASYSDPTLIGCVKPDGTQGDPTTLAGGASVKLDVPFGSDTIVQVWASTGSGSTLVQVTGES